MYLEVLYTDTMQKDSFDVNKVSCIVGRSPKADVTVNHEGLSRTHFQLELVNGEFFVTDLNSTNGVIINGERIPAGVRIPYKPIFPIEIAEKISISVFAETVEQPISNANLTSTTTRAKKKEQVASDPAIKQPIRPAGSTQEKLKKPEGKALPAPVMGVALLVIIGLVWHFTQNQDPGLENTTDIKVQKRARIKKEGPAISDFSPSEIDFASNIGTAQCSDFKSLCSALGLTDMGEGISVVNNKYIVYVNLDAAASAETSPNFQKISEKSQHEYILGQVGTHPALRGEMESKKPTHLLIVGFKSINNKPVPKNLLQVNYQRLPSMTEEIHKNLFIGVFKSGVTWPYQKYTGSNTRLLDL